jgi:succinate dehydrogenase/fumarate reductase flavoprotein subunit
MKDLSRRKFLQGALLTGAGAIGAGTLAACSPQSSGAASDASTDETGTGAVTGTAAKDGTVYPWLEAEPQIADGDVTEEVEGDVVIVGCGVAGVAAARAAAEAGAKVIAFEKGAGVGCRSGDYAYINGTLTERWGRDVVDENLIIDHEMDECSQHVKRPIWSKWVKNSADAFDWWITGYDNIYICDSDKETPPEGTEVYIVPKNWPVPTDYDWKTEEHPCYPTGVAVTPSQEPLVKANMDKAIAEGDVTPYWGHSVVKLIMDGERCVGVYAKNLESGGYVKATASKSVILSCGEYGSNPAMVEYFCPAVTKAGVQEMWTTMGVDGQPSNVGDGLKFGAWIGARIQEHHAPMIHHMGGNNNDGPSMETAMGIMGIDPFLRLDKDGKRFMNEDTPGQQTENQIELLRDTTCYMLWDSTWQEQFPKCPAAHGIDISATPETMEEAVSSGRVLKADTIEALLDAIGDINKETAKASIARYTELVKKGVDEDFGKVASRMFPVESGPFYAQSMGISQMLVCIGGLESDEDTHVLSDDRKVIPGLYAAGNIQGNRFAVQYPIAMQGVSHSMAMYYGMIAGKNAVAEV